MSKDKQSPLYYSRRHGVRKRPSDKTQKAAGNALLAIGFFIGILILLVLLFWAVFF